MLSNRSIRSYNGIILAVISTVIVAGCSRGTVSSGVTSAPSTTRTIPATTASPTTKASPTTTASPTTVNQATWIAGVKALRKKMTAAVGTSASKVITSQWMRDASKRLGRCTAELSRLGPATGNVQVIFVAAKRGCAKYQEAARCLASGNPDGPELGKCLDAMNQAEGFFSAAEVAADTVH
jgi:hypothetical protein